MRTTPAAAIGLPPYMSELPLPGAATGSWDAEKKAVRYALELRPTGPHSWHPNLPLDTLWGYADASATGAATSPGPAIIATRGEATNLVTDRYKLAAEGARASDPEHGHRLADSVDWDVWEGAQGDDLDRVRGLTHLHGGFIKGSNDGNPYANPHDFEMNAEQSVYYPNVQRAGLIWYHDHAHFMTRLNVMAGLFGPYIIHDDWDDGTAGNDLMLPAGPSAATFGNGAPVPFEVPLIVQDRMYDDAGYMTYPSRPWTPEFFGGHITVNQAVEPYLPVESGHLYRFRLLNGSNARFYNLEFTDSDGSPRPFYMVGSDGGLFGRVVGPLTNVVLAPAERADVVFDFSNKKGKPFPAGTTIDVRNRPLPRGVVSPGSRVQTVMRFVVSKTRVSAKPNTTVDLIDGRLGERYGPDSGDAGFAVVSGPFDEPPKSRGNTRNITLEEVEMELGSGAVVPMPLLNAKGFHAHPTNASGDGPNMAVRAVDETPVTGTPEEWRFINMTPDSHPIHTHLVMFQIAERWTFDGVKYKAAIDMARAGDPAWNSDTGQPRDPHHWGVDVKWHQDAAPGVSPFDDEFKPVKVAVPPEDQGWKDTVRADPNQITVIRAKFDAAPGPSADGSTEGQDDKYVYHCHILEHEDHDMMRPYELG